MDKHILCAKRRAWKNIIFNGSYELSNKISRDFKNMSCGFELTSDEKKMKIGYIYIVKMQTSYLVLLLA